MPTILGVRFGRKSKSAKRNREADIAEARDLLRQFPNADRRDLVETLAARRSGQSGTFRGIPTSALRERRKRRK